MKFVVYGLVLLNMAMLGWLYQHRDDYRDLPASATQLPTSSEPLVLLRERGKAESASVAAVSTTPAEETKLSSPAPTSAPVVEAMDGTASDRITPSVAAPSTETAVLASENKPTCQTIGPFAERQTADALVAEVSALGPSASVRTASVEQPSGYWVYLPSMPLSQAQRIVSDFEKKGVKDYFLGRQNFISLGVFTDKRSADARTQAITALGYSPKLEPRFLSREVYWVDIEEMSSEPVSADQWSEVLGKQTGIRRQPLACE